MCDTMSTSMHWRSTRDEAEGTAMWSVEILDLRLRNDRSWCSRPLDCGNAIQQTRGDTVYGFHSLKYPPSHRTCCLVAVKVATCCPEMDLGTP